MPDASRFRPVLRLLGWTAVPIAAQCLKAFLDPGQAPDPSVLAAGAAASGTAVSPYLRQFADLFRSTSGNIWSSQAHSTFTGGLLSDGRNHHLARLVGDAIQQLFEAYCRSLDAAGQRSVQPLVQGVSARCQALASPPIDLKELRDIFAVRAEQFGQWSLLDLPDEKRARLAPAEIELMEQAACEDLVRSIHPAEEHGNPYIPSLARRCGNTSWSRRGAPGRIALVPPPPDGPQD